MIQLSYVHGASDRPLIGETIGAHFDRVAERFGKRDALIVRHQQIRWTYRELKARVDAFAAGLIALGLKRGDRVGIWSPNKAEWVITQLSTAKTGSFSSTSTPLIAPPSSNTRSTKRAASRSSTAARFKSSDYDRCSSH
jgi:fatty-acyl-CoA synthase